MGTLTKTERELRDSRIVKLATIGLLSASEIATQLSIPESAVKRILNQNYDRIRAFNEKMDTALTHEELAHFREARRIFFAHAQHGAYRLIDLLDSRDPRIVLDAFDRVARATGIDIPPSETSARASDHPPMTFNAEQMALILSSPPPPAPLPTGLPADHPLSQRTAPDVSANPSKAPIDQAPAVGSGADPLPLASIPGRPSVHVLPKRRSAEDDAASHARFVPVLSGS